MPVTLKEIAVALQGLFSGYSLTTVRGVLPVPVFIDDPPVEQFPDRVYPSISIYYNGHEEQADAQESDDDDVVSEDTSGFPYTRVIQEPAVWYLVSFKVHSFSLDWEAKASLSHFVSSRKRTKDGLEIGGEWYYLFHDGADPADSRENDRKVYSDVWTFDVVADLQEGASPTEQTRKQIHQVEWTTGVIKTAWRDRQGDDIGQVGLYGLGYRFYQDRRLTAVPVDADGNRVSAKDAVYYPFRTVTFDDT